MAAQPAVTVYTEMLCPYCHRARKLLEERDVAFDEIDVTGKPDVRDEMARRAGGVRTVPQVFVGDVHVGGSDDLAAAAGSGELDRLSAGPERPAVPAAPLRIACGQITSTPDVEANLRVVSGMVREAAEGDADLVAFPEMTPILAPSADMRAAAAPEDGHPAVEAVSAVAKESGRWVLLGSAAVSTDDPGGRLANRSFLVNPDGETVARYDKIHMFDADPAAGESYRESDLYLPGDRAVVAETPWGTLGMTVCYDMRFPELFRALARAGAWFVSVPAAFTRPTGEAHWETLLRARAVETGSYVFAPAQCGLHYGRRRTWGHSLVVDPWGAVVAAAGEEPGLVFADLDPARSKEARKRIASLRHDRPWTPPSGS